MCVWIIPMRLQTVAMDESHTFTCEHGPWSWSGKRFVKCSRSSVSDLGERESGLIPTNRSLLHHCCHYIAPPHCSPALCASLSLRQSRRESSHISPPDQLLRLPSEIGGRLCSQDWQSMEPITTSMTAKLFSCKLCQVSTPRQSL